MNLWSEQEVRSFLENNLGLSKEHKKRGRIVSGHNESLFFWRELIEKGDLVTPFEVIHVDSHGDLGCGYLTSVKHILDCVLYYPVEERYKHPRYINRMGEPQKEGIGDYLLFAIAYRWISRIVYCSNPHSEPNDYAWQIIKNFDEQPIWDKPAESIIQLLYNPDMEFPLFDDDADKKKDFIDRSQKEPEVPLLIIPTNEDVSFDGNFDFAVLAQSPNYTPASADFIMDIFRDYIIEE